MPEEIEAQFLSSEELVNLLQKLDDNGLVKEGKLDLDVFNDNLKGASENLGRIIPSIVEVSKEQVALINHGLESVINFIRSFQTVNTTFAVMAENTDKIDEFKEDMGKVQDLEQRIVEDVKSSMTSLGALLKETFIESAAYYSVLGQIIYSEKAEEIIFEYTRSDSLKSDLQKFIPSFKREYPDLSKTTFKKALGLIQLIKSLEQVSNQLQTVTLPDKTEVYEAKIAGKEKPIFLKVDVLKSLKSLSGELIGSLNKVGLLVKDEHAQVKVLRYDQYQQLVISQYGLDLINQSINGIKRDRNIIQNFMDKCLELKRTGKIVVSEREGYEKFKIEKELTGTVDYAKGLHDEIVRNQLVFITKTVDVFIQIVSLWGDQVKNEVHVGQVAGRAALALKTLTDVQKKVSSDVNEETLLIAADTQEIIRTTCADAEQLVNVGKVMKFLMERLKALVAFNENINSQISTFYKKSLEGKEFKNDKIDELRKVINARFPQVKERIRDAIKEFAEKLDKLSGDKNLIQDKELFERFNVRYGTIKSSLDNFKKLIDERTKTLSITNFKDSCSALDTYSCELNIEFEEMFSNLKGLKKTFNDDFKVFIELSEAYKVFVKELGTLLEFMDYIISIEKRLAAEKIDLKTLNYTIPAFQKLFENLKKGQSETANNNIELAKVMASVRLSARDYFKGYRNELDKTSNGLFSRLEAFVKTYFSDQERFDAAYEKVKSWVSTFEINFKDYNKQLRKAQGSFFDKLFQTEDYKKSAFFEKLTDIQKSLEIYETKIQNLEKVKFARSKEKGESVKTFCENAPKLVKDMLAGYSSVINELYDITNTMFLVVGNLKLLTDEGYIKQFNKLLQSIQTFNKDLDKIEAETKKDFEEFIPVDVTNMVATLKQIPDFSKLYDLTSSQIKLFSGYKKEMEEDIITIRSKLITFFLAYVVAYYGKSKEAVTYLSTYKDYIVPEVYEKLLKKATSE